MKLFLNHLDIWLGRLVVALMLPLLYLSFLALSLLMLYVISVSIFEYGAGFSDVDRLEILLMSLLILASYRLFYRGRQQHWSYWRLLKRFFFATATVTLMDTFVFNVIISMLLRENGKVLMNDLHQFTDTHLFISGAILVLALYAAAPLPPLFKGKQVENELPVAKADNADKTDKSDMADETISGRGEGFTYKDVNEQSNKQANEPVDPWLVEGVVKNSQINKGV